MPCLQVRIPGVEQQCDPVLPFGSVAVGKSSQKSFEIFNPTPVRITAIRIHITPKCKVLRALTLFSLSLSPCLSQVTTSFTLSLLTDWVPLTGMEFTCDMTDGEVVPGGSVWANASFTPTVVDSSSIQYLSLKCRGAVIETLLKLSGGCIGSTCSTHTRPKKQIISKENNSSFSFCNQVQRFHCPHLWWILAVLRKEKNVCTKWSW